MKPKKPTAEIIQFPKPSVADKILAKHNLTPRELDALLSSSHRKPQVEHRIRSAGQRVRFGVISDAHIGHKEFDEGLFQHARIIPQFVPGSSTSKKSKAESKPARPLRPSVGNRTSGECAG